MSAVLLYLPSKFFCRLRMVNLSWWLLLGLISLNLYGCAAQRSPDLVTAPPQREEPSPDEFARQRRLLVERIRSHGINNEAVLNALMKVPRHRFVPSPYKHLSYGDHPLPIGHDQTISQPFIVAYMTQAAEVGPGERVLEIGTGSGYQAAVLAEIAKEVYSVEIIPALAESARALLRDLGYQNVHVKAGNGYEGWAEHSPFDAIVVTAAPDHVPQALVNQLAVNGKMVIPVGTGNQEMVEITKTASGVVEKRTLSVRFVPMTGKPKN